MAVLYVLSMWSSHAAVSATGLNNFGQSTVPGAAANAVFIEGGREFSHAILADGSAVGWGHPGDGRSTPPADLARVVTLSSGIYHTLALKAGGTVTGWGFAGNNVLAIPADLNNVIAVAAGGYHSLAVRRDGTVVGWGFSGNGRTIPPASLTDVIAIDAGLDHSLALKSDGTVVAWGSNGGGQGSVPGGLAGGIAIAAGDNHNLVLKSDGTVVAWGLNNSGQCDVPDGLAGVVAIAAGGEFSLALKSDGSVTGWGSNSNGQLNLTGSDIHAIAAGGYHSLVLRGAGPLITRHPMSQTALAGTGVAFTVTSGGSGLTYQWQFNGQDIMNATEASLSIAQASIHNAGTYGVRVTDANGSTMSRGAVLIVRGLQQMDKPVILQGGGLRLVFGDQNGDPIHEPNVARYQLEVSDDLEEWLPLDLQMQLVGGRIQVDDADAVNHARRFYRVVER